MMTLEMIEVEIQRQVARQRQADKDSLALQGRADLTPQERADGDRECMVKFLGAQLKIAAALRRWERKAHGARTH